MHLVTTAFFEAHTIPQDLVTGVIVTLLGLTILYTIKPRLKISEQAGLPAATSTTTGGGKDTFGFEVENVGRIQVIELRARLLWVNLDPKFATRGEILLRQPELFQLSGRWTPRRKRPDDLGPRTTFRFRVKENQVMPDLTGHKYLLLQVSGKHGFTNFSRVALQRWTYDGHALIPWNGGQHPRKPPENKGDEKSGRLS